MKTKNSKKRTENAIEVVNSLKATEETQELKGQNTSVIKTIETSVRKIERLKKELLALKEKIRNKKVAINDEKEIMWSLVQEAKKTLKTNPAKKEKSAKKEKKSKVETTEELA